MAWVIGILLVLFALDVLRIRARAAQLAALGQEGEIGAFEAVTAPGVHLAPQVAGAAAEHARSRGLEVVDLVPADLPALTAVGLLQLVDPKKRREDAFARGATAGHALIGTKDVLDRAGDRGEGVIGFLRLAMSMKRYACRTTDLVVAPGLSAVEPIDAERWTAMREVAGGMAAGALVVQLAIWTLLAVAIATEPVMGLALLVLYNLQPLLGLWGSALKPDDLVAVSLLRPLLELDVWRRTVVAALQTPAPPDPIEALREKYDAMLGQGLEPFFEPRRGDCPLCRQTGLDLVIEVPDLYQNKPGTFRLERCRSCAHVFQNPRLTIDGLSFYYGDFYDGLGESGLEGVFGFSAEPYIARAEMVRQVGAVPQAWLDVGTGHGHFCCAARDVFPQTTFDGLDLSDSIEEAERRRWVDHGYRGLFPDLAAEHEGRYDVVSMSHYLEHTREPVEEIAAAHTVLKPGGHLLIEVPDPDCKTGSRFGRFWLPWFQPQHQHFLSVTNLERVFSEQGFEALAWHRGEAHQSVDLLFAAMIAVGRIAPRHDVPWRPPATLSQRIRHGVVWTIGTPFILLAWGLDALLAPLMRRPGLSNTYRVLARRT